MSSCAHLPSERDFTKFLLLQSVMTPDIDIVYHFRPFFLLNQFLLLLPEAGYHRGSHLMIAMIGLSIQKLSSIPVECRMASSSWMVAEESIAPDLLGSNKLHFFSALPQAFNFSIPPP